MTAPPVTSFLAEFVEGWAQVLACETTGFVWQESGVYTAGQVGIFAANVPTAPDKIVTLTPIPVTAHPTLSIVGVDLQVRFRAGQDPRVVWGMRDAARYVLTGLFPTVLPTGVHVSAMTFGYGASMGMDDSRRWQWADLWHCTATDPRR